MVGLQLRVAFGTSLRGCLANIFSTMVDIFIFSWHFISTGLQNHKSLQVIDLEILTCEK